MKQKFVNSISLVAVCAVLAGCGDGDGKKSLEQLKGEINKSSATLAVMASQAGREASNRGVPLPPEVAAVFKKDETSGKEDVPDSASGLLTELNEATDDLTTLADSAAFQEAKKINVIYGEIIREKAKRTNSLREALKKYLENNPSTIKGGADAPNNSFASQSDSPGLTYVPSNTSEGEAQISTPESPVLINAGQLESVDFLEVMSALSRSSSTVSLVLSDLSDSSDDDVNNGTSVATYKDLGRPPLAPRKVDVPGVGVVSVQTDARSLSDAIRVLHSEWLGISYSDDRGINSNRSLVPGKISSVSSVGTDPNTAEVRIPTDEAVRRAAIEVVRHTDVTEAVLGKDARPEVVAAITNIGVLRQLQGVPEFAGLTPDQEKMALQLAIGMGHSARWGDVVTFSDKVRAMVIVVRSLGTLFPEGVDDEVRRLLAERGFANAQLIDESIRLRTLAARLVLTPPIDRANVVMRVLMIADRPGGLTDAEYNAIVADVAKDPNRAIADIAKQYGVNNSTADRVRAGIESLSTEGSTLSAITAQAQQAITDGAVADPHAGALALSVANRRALAARGSTEGLSPLDGNGLGLGAVIGALPTKMALDTLLAAQDAGVEGLSTQRKDALALLKFAAVPAVSNGDNAATQTLDPAFMLPTDPKVEISNFTLNYRRFTGLNNGQLQLKNRAALTVLQKSIKDVTIPGDQTSFKQFPFDLTLSYLGAVTVLPTKYIPLLYAANGNDSVLMPRLVTYVIDDQGMLDTLGYFPNVPAGSWRITTAMKSAWEKVAKLSNGRVGAAPFILRGLKDIDASTYNAVLDQLGKAVEAYLDAVRDDVMNVVHVKESSQTREAILKKLNEQSTSYSKALANHIKSHVDTLVIAVDKNFPKAGIKIESKTVLNFVKANISLLTPKGVQQFKENLYGLILKEGTVVKGVFSKQTLNDYLTNTVKDQKVQTALYEALQSGIEQAIYSINEFVVLLSTPDQVTVPSSRVEELSAGLSETTFKDISSIVSLRQARTASTGSANLAGFKMNGVAGQSVDLGLSLFVQLKGDVSSAKATEATTGSVAYRLGNTVIGAIQGYANSGDGFGIDSRQLETSVVASQSFGSFFIEGQIGSVSATDVHLSDWSGLRSQVTIGLDTEFVTPFVQLTHRQLDRSGVFDLSETTAYVGLDVDVAKLAVDTYSIDTRLLAKVGYGSKDWSAGSKDVGSTTGFSGSVEWSTSLNLNSGVAFSSNLAIDSSAGSSAGLTVSLDR